MFDTVAGTRKRQEYAFGTTDLVLVTPGIALRPLSPEDLTLATRLVTAPRVTRYICDLCTLEEPAADFGRQTRLGAGGRLGVWTQTCRDTGEKVRPAVLFPCQSPKTKPISTL